MITSRASKIAALAAVVAFPLSLAACGDTSSSSGAAPRVALLPGFCTVFLAAFLALLLLGVHPWA